MSSNTNISMSLNLIEVETELKKRHAFPYNWFRKQNDKWDNYTNFIYHTSTWETLIAKIEEAVKSYQLDREELFYYARNRWYNFWSAKAIEQVFCSCFDVNKEINPKHKWIDFRIKQIPFDHKTSIFPKNCNLTLSEALNNKRELISWLYQNQSKEKRHHLKNRIFIVVFAKSGRHWKLKAEIKLLEKEIKNYVLNFKSSQLQKFIFTPQNETFSDIIWLIK